MLVKTHQGQIQAFLRRLTRNAALADDLAQDTFLQAFEKIDQIKDTAKTKSWGFQIAYRVFLDHLRKTERRCELCTENTLPDQDHPSAPNG